MSPGRPAPHHPIIVGVGRRWAPYAGMLTTQDGADA
jgi:hypothetical protein